jgi:hypothetical protein
MIDIYPTNSEFVSLAASKLDALQTFYVTSDSQKATPTREFVLANGRTNSTPVYSQLISNNKPYFLLLLLLLLLIPLLLILLVSFMCCYGRLCLMHCLKKYGCNICICLRPEKQKKYANGLGKDKIFDSAIVYNEVEQRWLDEKFMPYYSQLSKGYKISKIGMSDNVDLPLNNEQTAALRTSKRIVLICSHRFMSKNWRNKCFKHFLREIYLNDSSCIIIAINISDLDNNQMQNYIDEFISEISASFKNKKLRTIKAKLEHNIKHSLSLNRIERLNLNEENFGEKLQYLLPISENRNRLTEISNCKETRSKNQVYFAFDTDTEVTSETTSNRPTFQNENELNLITKLEKPIDIRYDMSQTRIIKNEIRRAPPLSTNFLITPSASQNETIINCSKNENLAYEFNRQLMWRSQLNKSFNLTDGEHSNYDLAQANEIKHHSIDLNIITESSDRASSDTNLIEKRIELDNKKRIIIPRAMLTRLGSKVNNQSKQLSNRLVGDHYTANNNNNKKPKLNLKIMSNSLLVSTRKAKNHPVEKEPKQIRKNSIHSLTCNSNRLQTKLKRANKTSKVIKYKVKQKKNPASQMEIDDTA